MDSLIDPIKREWIPELVDRLFCDRGCRDYKKKIPLSCVASEDKLYWPYSSNGVSANQDIDFSKKRLNFQLHHKPNQTEINNYRRDCGQ